MAKYRWLKRRIMRNSLDYEGFAQLCGSAPISLRFVYTILALYKNVCMYMYYACA